MEHVLLRRPELAVAGEVHLEGGPVVAELVLLHALRRMPTGNPNLCSMTYAVGSADGDDGEVELSAAPAMDTRRVDANATIARRKMSFAMFVLSLAWSILPSEVYDQDV